MPLTTTPLPNKGGKYQWINALAEWVNKPFTAHHLNAFCNWLEQHLTHEWGAGQFEFHYLPFGWGGASDPLNQMSALGVTRQGIKGFVHLYTFDANGAIYDRGGGRLHLADFLPVEA
jgi:hypothetical protein